MIMGREVIVSEGLERSGLLSRETLGNGDGTGMNGRGGMNRSDLSACPTCETGPK